MKFLLTAAFFSFRRETPIENTQPPPVVIKPEPDKQYDSPPPSIRISDNPPPLTRGKKFLRTNDGVTKNCTKSTTNIKQELNGLPEKVYNLRKMLCDEDNNGKTQKTGETSKSDIKTEVKAETKVTRMRRKRHVKIETSDDSPTKVLRSGTRITQRIPSQKVSSNKTETITSPTSTITSVSPSCSTSQTAPTCSIAKQYTDLKYLESIGSIRTIRKIKHPGINKVPTSKMTNISTPFVSPESQNGWDRKTKLKLSYRLGSLGSNDIQFALIIYEPLTMMSRRNLLEEFERAAADEKEAKTTTATTSTSTTTTTTTTTNPEPVKTFVPPKVTNGKVMKSSKIKNDKFISLRRLRF